MEIIAPQLKCRIDRFLQVIEMFYPDPLVDMFN